MMSKLAAKAAKGMVAEKKMVAATEFLLRPEIKFSLLKSKPLHAVCPASLFLSTLGHKYIAECKNT